MLLASGWSGTAVISFAPDLSGRNSSFGRSRSLESCTWKENWKKVEACDKQHSMTSPVSMQYQAQISDHSTPGNCFHSLSCKVCRCHIWKHLGADNQGRRLDGIPLALFCRLLEDRHPPTKEKNRKKKLFSFVERQEFLTANDHYDALNINNKLFLSFILFITLTPIQKKNAQ